MIDGTWLGPKASLPTTRYMFGLGVVQGQLHALGGSVTTTPAALATHEVFAPSSNTWSSLPAMPTARFALGVATIGNQLYAIGGFTISPDGSRTAVGTNEMYDPATRSWTELAPMPTPRGEVAVGVVQGKVYVVGGQSVDCVAVNEAYDPVSNTWSSCAQLSAGCAGIAGAVVNDVLFLCGGAGDNETVLSTVLGYDAPTDSYTPMAPMPTARWLAGAAVAQGQVFVLGGSLFSTEQGITANEAYDPLANTWSSQDPVPHLAPLVPWAVAAAGISQLIAGQVYFLNGQDPTQMLEYLTSPFDAQEE